MAEQDVPSTPVLGCGITQALLARFLSPGGFLTSRVNWAIQSSGVDYLHLLVVSMKYLIGYFDIDARLAITVHDEVRYMVKEEHATIAAYCLQVANLWTRAMFSEQMGIHDLPQVSLQIHSKLFLISSLAPSSLKLILIMFCGRKAKWIA